MECILQFFFSFLLCFARIRRLLITLRNLGYMKYLLTFFFIAVVTSLDAFTSVSMVRYDENVPRFTLFALDEEGNPTSNSFTVTLQFLQEIDPASGVVASFDANEESIFSYSPPEIPSTAGGLQYLHAHQIIYTRPSGAQVILFLFTADQTVMNIASGRIMEVKNGDTKNSYRNPFFPFSSPATRMEVSILMETQIPDSIYYCSIPDEETPDLAQFICEAEDIWGTGAYFTDATTTNLFNGYTKPISAEVDFFVCPLHEEFATEDTGNICSISLAEVGTYPLFYETDECNREASIEAIEIRIRFDNFLHASLDYDPDFSVFFSGAGDACDESSNYIDFIIPWLSFTFLIAAFLFVLLAFVATEIFFRVRACEREQEFEARTTHINQWLDMETEGEQKQQTVAKT